MNAPRPQAQQPQAQAQQPQAPATQGNPDQGMEQVKMAFQTLVAFFSMLKQKGLAGADSAIQHLQAAMQTIGQNPQGQQAPQPKAPAMQGPTGPIPIGQQGSPRPMGQGQGAKPMMTNQRPMVA